MEGNAELVVETILVLIAALLGALIHGSIGFGFAFVAVPILALINPEVLPATVLLLMLPMTTLMTLREWHSINVLGFLWVISGRLLGTLAGVALIVAISARFLSVSIGACILVAVVMSLFGPDFEPGNTTRFIGGAASGVMGATAGLGGPPLALVYQKASGAELRSTLALSFLLGIIVSLAGLTIVGEIKGEDVSLALQMLPAMLLGFWGSRRLAGRLDRRWLRPVVLAFAGASGIVVLLLNLSA